MIVLQYARELGNGPERFACHSVGQGCEDEWQGRCAGLQERNNRRCQTNRRDFFERSPLQNASRMLKRTSECPYAAD